MDRQEGRRILKGLQAIVNNRGDLEAEQVLEDVAAFVEQNQPKRQKRGGYDRREKGGRDRGDE